MKHTIWWLLLPSLCLSWRISNAEQLSDPTRPPLPRVDATAAAPAATRPARLEAVLHSDDRAVAIIDGKLLRVGDWVGNARIDAIGSDAVHLTREGRQLTLRLAHPAMKVRRTAPSKDPQ